MRIGFNYLPFVENIAGTASVAAYHRVYISPASKPHPTQDEALIPDPAYGFCSTMQAQFKRWLTSSQSLGAHLVAVYVAEM